MDQPRKVAKPARGHIYVLVQYCFLYSFLYQVPVYFLSGDMHIRARFTSVYYMYMLLLLSSH